MPSQIRVGSFCLETYWYGTTDECKWLVELETTETEKKIDEDTSKIHKARMKNEYRTELLSVKRRSSKVFGREDGL